MLARLGDQGDLPFSANHQSSSICNRQFAARYSSYVAGPVGWAASRARRSAPIPSANADRRAPRSHSHFVLLRARRRRRLRLTCLRCHLWRQQRQRHSNESGPNTGTGMVSISTARVSLKAIEAKAVASRLLLRCTKNGNGVSRNDTALIAHPVVWALCHPWSGGGKGCSQQLHRNINPTPQFAESTFTRLETSSATGARTLVHVVYAGAQNVSIAG